MNIGGNQLALMEILETIRTEAIDRGCEKKGNRTIIQHVKKVE